MIEIWSRYLQIQTLNNLLRISSRNILFPKQHPNHIYNKRNKQDNYTKAQAYPSNHKHNRYNNPNHKSIFILKSYLSPKTVNLCENRHSLASRVYSPMHRQLTLASLSIPHKLHCKNIISLHQIPVHQLKKSERQGCENPSVNTTLQKYEIFWFFVPRADIFNTTNWIHLIITILIVNHLQK